MGYVRQKKIYKLTWDESTGDMAGLEVRMTGVSVGEMLDGILLSEKTDRTAADVEKVFTEFAAALVSWNLMDEVIDESGVSTQPVPATLEGVRSCDFDFIVTINRRWGEAIAGVPDPLPGPSGSGPQSLEGSLPMEPLSPSQPN